jgi:hypothetical protein
MSIDVYWHLPVLQSGFRELWPYGPGSAFKPSLGIGLDASIRKTTPILAPVDGRLVVVPTSPLTCAVLLLPDPAVRPRKPGPTRRYPARPLGIGRIRQERTEKHARRDQ